MAVEVHGVWLGWGAGGNSLDDPEGPLVAVGEVDEVHVGRVGGVVVEDVLERGFLPGGVDSGEV